MRHALILAALVLLAITLPAGADTIFNLDSPTGNLGSSHTYTVNGFSLVAYAEKIGSALQPSLVGVNSGNPDESGLGLTCATCPGDDEIQSYNYVQVDFANPQANGVTGAQFVIGSVQTNPQEGWAIYGSNTLGSIGTDLLNSTADQTLTSIPSAAFSTYRYFSITATAYDVFLSEINLKGGTSGVPEPGTFLLVGLVLVGAGTAKYRARKPC